MDVEAVTAAFGTVEVVARGRAARAACPGCGRFSDRVHDRYQRRLEDLPRNGPRTTRRRPGAIPADAGSRACHHRVWAQRTDDVARPVTLSIVLRWALTHSRRSAFTAA
ncbi:transposase family protein [Streptomyces sp. NBC_01727]|uniref:transposase family protein n=1 Tax=Streptomyces sp. NBC_01727 TaxID=2975924 RepID=UPI002E0EB0EC